MRKNIFYYSMAAGMAILCICSGCRKNTGFYKDKATVRQFNGTSYEFLKSQPGVYDSFLYVMDRLNLTDSLKNNDLHFTVFAPTNASFERAIADVNRLRTIQKRPLQYLSNLPLDQLDSLTCRYLIRGIIPSDSMNTQDGIFFYAARYGYMMHGKLVTTNAEGMVKGGPQIIEFSDTKGVIYTRQWSTATTLTLDIKTSNGLVNVLDRNHEFGFDEFIERVNPTYSTPYTGVPLPIPGTIGVEQYDKGGRRVAYDVNHGALTSATYRTDELVYIENANQNGENGYDEGGITPGDWTNYTVNIADTGTYTVLYRVSSSHDDGSLHLELDNKRITGAIVVPNTTDYQKYVNIYSTVTLPKGRHILKLVTDYNGYNFRFMKFMPADKRYPVPGTIPAEEFAEGGEGVGYHDADGGNIGGKYRPDEGVDIEQNKLGGGYDVGWTNAGEWLNYNIDVKQTGQYIVSVRVATGNNPGGGRFHVEFDGANLTGSMSCPGTGGWQNWTDVTASVHLEKGDHVMTFYEDTNGYNFRSITLDFIH